MFIKKIELHNFRQFINTAIDFSMDNDRNVTVIMGDNGSGKTTLEQAFQWCLYGVTDFKIEEVINRRVRDNMKNYTLEKVEVILEVNHENIDYTIKRSKKFTRENNKIRESAAELTITYINADGIKQFLTENEKLFLIRRMIPRELARFFFFDGESIKKMSDEIEGRKSEEFKRAVQGLVGLTAILNTINHLRPSAGSNTVIGRYNRMIDEKSDEKAKEFSNEIERLEREIEFAQMRINEIMPQLKKQKQQQIEWNHVILSETPKMELKEKYQKIQSDIKHLEMRKNEQISKGLLANLDKTEHSFFAIPLIQKIDLDLETLGSVEQGIPKLHRDTLMYLLKAHKCVCGRTLEDGSPEYIEICKLLELVPPKSIGLLISEFKSIIKSEKKMGTNCFQNIENNMKVLRELEDALDVKRQESSEIFNALADTKRGEEAKEKLKEIDIELQKLEKELIEKNTDITEKARSKERKESERAKLININESNRDKIIYREYANVLYQAMKTGYTRKEENTRLLLELRMNQIFKDIYDGGILVSVDSKYNIKVTVNADDLDDDDELEKNTAQSYAIIFAFITAIIDMAKENAKKKALEIASENKDESEDMDDLYPESEVYPLVMDAPLSAFDKTRIKGICETIPNIADQVIIFIKDTDGEVAEKYIGPKIGEKYMIMKVDNSQVESIVEKR